MTTDKERAGIYSEGYKNGIADCLESIPEMKELGYDDSEKETPDAKDEFIADLYETKAEAWFAGWDEAVKKTKEEISKLL